MECINNSFYAQDIKENIYLNLYIYCVKKRMRIHDFVFC